MDGLDGHGQTRTTWTKWTWWTTAGVLLFLLFVVAGRTPAEEATVFAGQVVDAANVPVPAAQVYVYNSAQIKRPADFISAPTGKDGRFRVELQPGKFWALALLRSDGASFGPLKMGDKHSGEPFSFTIAAGLTMNADFTVLDLRDAAKRHQKRSDDLVRVTGKIVDAQGHPVAGAYVFADIQETKKSLPRYLSPWTDGDGIFELYVVKGEYFLGAARTYPLEIYRLSGKRKLERDEDKVIMPLGDEGK